ncbi:MAG: PorP/SprF family type IX secretion system membrane protein [Winogradskyella sp.]|uniref:PorP/SprF family type IX secretion system membrane protein n=1 Tax=Winogradskyella sp. TaxID=1883156 RepID=UPI00385F3B80
MTIKVISAIITAVLFVQISNAQDPIFTQSNYIQETINPGFSGFEDNDRISAGILSRTQWPNLDLQVSTQYFYINKSYENRNSSGSGIGFNALWQNESFTNYNYYQANVNYMHRVNLSGGWFFRPAIEVGFGFKDIGFSSLTLADQININSGVINPVSADPFSGNLDNVAFFDVSSGLVFEKVGYNGSSYWFGVSAKHLNRPSISFLRNENVPLDIFYSIHGNYRFPFLNDYTIMMTANYMQQGEYNRLDIGSLFQVNQFLIGVTAATNPARNDNDSHLLTSINGFIGLEYTNFRFGLSYDANVSNIGNTNGVYEFSLTYMSRCRSCPTDRSRKR